MNKQSASTVAALGLLVLALALWLFSQQGEQRSAVEQTPQSASIGEPPTAGANSLGESGLVSPQVDATTKRQAELAAYSGTRALVVGRVVDHNEVPLADVKVSLYAKQNWAAGVEAPRLSLGTGLVGWQQVTDDQGAFRFDVPTPSCPVTYLGLRPDIHHLRRVVKFPDAPNFYGAPSALAADGKLVEGTRDMGTIELARAAAITGTVVDEQGEPLEAVTVIAMEDLHTLGQGDSDSDGAFTVGHLPSDNVALHFGDSQSKFLLGMAGPFEVAAGETHDGGKTVLQRKPTITGHVESPDRKRLSDVHVVGKLHFVAGKPHRGARTERTVTDSDGSFSLSVHPDHRYALQARLENEEQRWMQSSLEHHAPSTRDVVLVLQPDGPTTFIVRDADTGMPIEDYGLQITRRPVLQFGHDGPPRHKLSVHTHPNGSYTTGARPGIDKVHVYAPGYQAFLGRVTHAGRKRRQIIEVSAWPELTGRVVSNDRAVAGVEVHLTDRYARLHTPPIDSPLLASATTQAVVTDADGRFAFNGVPSRTEHWLHVNAGDSGVIRVLVPVSFGARDLGDLELEAWSRIEGLVMVPFGTEPSGIAVHSDHAGASGPVLTDRSGRFVFERVPPGRVFLNLIGASEDETSDQQVDLHAPAGLTAQATLKLPTPEPTSVRVRVKGVKGSSLSRWSVRFERPPSLPPAPYLAGPVSLGTLTHDGVATGLLQPIGPARVVLTTARGIRIVPDHRWIELAPGRSIEMDLKLDFGTLELVFPPAIAWPEKGSASISIGDEAVVVSITSGKLVPRAPMSLNAAGHLLIPNLPTGNANISCKVGATDMASLARALSSGSKSLPGKTFYDNGVGVRLTAGETTVATLP